MKAFRILIPALLAACVMGASAESLWTPGFDGYLTTRSAVEQGDIVYVEIDGSSSLSFQAATSDARSLTLEFSGGEFGNLFSFLPATRSGGNQSLKGKQEYALKSRFAARVTQVDPNGKVRIEGSRGVSLEGKQESLALSGWLEPADLRAGREVKFSQLADARLSFRTLIQPAAATLTTRDIQQIAAALAAAPAGAAAPSPAAGAPSAAPAAQPAGQAAGYQLTDAKKLELFLRYINRLIDFLFQQ